MGFVLRVVFNMLAIILASYLVPGIFVESLLVALGAGLVLGIVNALIKPILTFFTLPITVLTLGLFLFALNGFCLWLVTLVVPGFHLSGVWPAILGAFVISVVSWGLTFISGR